MQTGRLASIMPSSADAFDEFYRSNRRDAVKWATALVGDRAIGEEIAHDALAAVGQRLSSLDNPAGYLRRTVVNRAASWHRWQGRERHRMIKALFGLRVTRGNGRH